MQETDTEDWRLMVQLIALGIIREIVEPISPRNRENNTGDSNNDGKGPNVSRDMKSSPVGRTQF
jgi:hypothetical protein